VVIHFDKLPLSAQAKSAFAPQSLTHKLNVRATAALEAAREMRPGTRRAKAMNKAVILRNVEIHEHFLGKGTPAR